MWIEIVLSLVGKPAARVTVRIVVVVAASAAGRVATDDVDVGGGWEDDAVSWSWARSLERVMMAMATDSLLSLEIKI